VTRVAGRPFDPRLTPARGDIAAAHLKGEIEAERYVEAAPMQVSASVAPLWRAPAADAPQETQALFGEVIDVYDERDGFGWGQAREDGYVGWVDMEALSSPPVAPTHRVSALRTYVFSEPDIKSAPLRLLSMNAKVAVEAEEGRFARLFRGGWAVTHHLALTDAKAEDFVAVAETFLHAPYFWGGKESLGLDCSALVQNALERCGTPCPRDTDMQEAALGTALDAPFETAELRRGDLVFWKGHVGIMVDGTRMIHANATHMAVTVNDVRDFAKRVEASTGPVTSVRRF